MISALEASKLKHNEMIRKTSFILKWVRQTNNQRTKLHCTVPLNSLFNIVNPFPERETPFAHKIQQNVFAQKMHIHATNVQKSYIYSTFLTILLPKPYFKCSNMLNIDHFFRNIPLVHGF